MANLHRAFAPHVAGKTAFKPVDKTATVDRPITITLAGEGYNLEHVTLDAPITLTLTGVADAPAKATLDAPIVLTSTTAADVVRTGVLDAPVTITLTGAATYGQNATLNRAITPTLTAIGKVEIKGQASNSISVNHPLVLTAQGSVPNKATLAASITPTLTASAAITSLRAAVTLPAMTGTSTLAGTPPNDLTLPALTIVAQMESGNLITADLKLPKLTIQAHTAHTASGSLPALTSTGVMAPGRLLTAAVNLSTVRVSATLESETIITAALLLPPVASTGVIQNSGFATAAIRIPALRSAGTIIQGNNATANLALPALTASSSLAENGVLTMATVLAIPLPYTNAQMHNGAVTTFNPYAMNTETYSVSQYDNYDFHSVFERNGRYYGSNASGIFELDGADDVGVDINATVLFGFSDFDRAGLKRVPYVYLGYVSDGNMTVDVSIDGEPTARQYPVGNISNTTGVKRGRAKIARGLKSRYWQFGASNVAGADFELDEFGFYIQQFDRKAQ